MDEKRDLTALREIINAWQRAEYDGKDGSRLARQLALRDLHELWRAELVGWGKMTPNGSFAPS